MKFNAPILVLFGDLVGRQKTPIQENGIILNGSRQYGQVAACRYAHLERT